MWQHNTHLPGYVFGGTMNIDMMSVLIPAYHMVHTYSNTAVLLEDTHIIGE